jgi:hypothetical protein
MERSYECTNCMKTFTISSVSEPSAEIPETKVSRRGRQALSQARAACALTPAAALFAQKSLSISLDTHVREGQDHLEVSPF